MEQLEKYFDTAIEAPDGIKSLKELILLLAMTGHLSNDNEKTETATDHLYQLRRRREQLSKNGELRNFEAIKQITSNEITHPLPSNWQWVRFIEILDFQGGSQPPKRAFSIVNQKGYVQLIQIRDLGPNPQPVYVAKDSVSKFCTDQDIMVGRYGASVGKVFWGKNGAYNVALIKLIDAFDSYDKFFLYYLMISPIGQNLFTGISRSAQDGFSKDDISQKLIPLPPYKEQIKIVATIDQLMSRCDELEKLRTKRYQKRLAVHTAAIRKMLDAPDQETFDDAWQFITRHFGDLYTVRENVAELRKAILQLAVMGKLVPQDEKEGTAKEMLDKLVSKKNHLIKKGAIRRSTITENGQSDRQISNSLGIPKTWEWVNLKELGYFLGGKTPSTNKPTYWNGSIPWVSPKDMKSLSIQDSEDHVTESGVKSGLAMIPANSILMVVRSGILRRAFPVAINMIDCTINQDLKGLVPYSREITPYLLLMLRGFETNILSKLTKQGVTVESIKFEEFVSMQFPLPPHLEQNRIVSKVHQLIQLCDNIVIQIDAALKIQEELLSVLLGKFAK